MKLLSLILLAVCFSVNTYAQQDAVELKNKLREIRDTEKANVAPKRYDGSKITYYKSEREDSYKEVEVVLFMRNNYTLNFNLEGAEGKVDIHYYDKAITDPNKVLIAEDRNVSGSSFSKDVKELNELYRMRTGSDDELRTLTIVYIIKGTKKNNRGGMVLVLSYE